MTWDLSELPWLPAAPDDFRNRCKAAESVDHPGLALRSLANHRLDSTQLYRLANTIGRVSAAEAASDLAKLRLGFLSNGTTELITPALIGSAIRHGVLLQVIEPPFDQAVQQALDPASTINRSCPDLVLLALDYRALPLQPCPGDTKGAQAAIEAAHEYLTSLRCGIHDNCGAPAIIQTLPPPASALFGSLDASIPGTLAHMIAALNQRIIADVAESSDLIFDVAALAGLVGLDRWHDPTQWNLGKFPFGQGFVPIYADWLGRLLGAVRGKSRKCLVLDLDNTLWEGVIGDDGLAGIVLGKGNPTGEAFLEMQQAALALRERGVLLAVSSKNDDAVARTAVASHPEMLIREDHLAIFQANWTDKATNLRVIAETLNIGLDALVLVDDNPAERDQVRQALPEVAVPELPQDPAFYARTVLAAGYFEAVSFSADDRARAGQYAANARRAEFENRSTDLASYLKSLCMTATMAGFDAIGRSRITQLINKTNQFNLTTRRYTEAQVEQFERDPTVFTLQIRLADRFGDNGMISVIVCRAADSHNWEIDTWLMSCRVLNRGVEAAALNYIIAEARRRGIQRLIGHYIPTGRNSLVAEHYAKLGFSKSEGFFEGSVGTVRWQLEVAEYEDRTVPIEIVSLAPAIAPAGYDVAQ
jgi:FkbH-like protein